MKLLKLKITNIASVTSATIDFTAEPLASASVYLITGNTGAGKTTILDSICLALYGTTPRLQRLAETGHKSVELIDGSKYTDSRAMARRDSVEAAAELEFLGNDGIRYCALWATARPYKKQGKPFRTPTHLLQFVENGREVVIDKVTPFKERIEQAVGLDFNKFCRTTMLAQGDFTRFLQAPNDEKSEILEKITGTDIYRRISLKIRENYKQRKDTAEELRNRLRDIVLMTPEELEATESEVKTLEESGGKLKEYSQELMNNILWLDNDITMKGQLAELEKALSEAESRANSQGIIRQKELVAQYELTEKPRNWHAEAQKAAAAKQKATHDLEELAAHAHDLRGGLEYIRVSIHTSKQRAEELNSIIGEESQNAAVYDNEPIIIEKIKALISDRKSIKAYSNKLRDIDNNINKSLRKEVETATAKNDAAKAEQNRLTQSIEDLEAILDAKHPDRVRQILDTLKNEKLKVERRLEIIRLEQAVATDRQQLGELTATLTKEKLTRDKARELYERERESVDQLINKLRSELTLGCDCPLCRQRVDVLPVQTEIELLITGYESSFRAADEKVKLTEANINQLTAKIEVTQKQIDSENTGLNEPLRTLEAINSEIASVEKLLDEINSLSLKIRESRLALKNAISAANDAGNALNNVSAKLNKELTRRAAVEGQISSLNARIEILETEILNLTAEYKSSQSPIKQPEVFAEKLTESARKYNRAIEVFKDLNLHINRMQETYSRNIAIIDSLGLHDDSPATAIEQKNIDSDINELTAKVAATRQILNDSDQKIKENRLKIEAFMAENDISEFIFQSILEISATEIAGARREIAAASDRLLSCKTSLNDARKRYGLHLANRPDRRHDKPLDELKAEKLKADEDTLEINRQIGVITQKLQADAAARTVHAERMKQLDEAQKEEQRWKQLDDLFGDSTGKKFVTIAQTYVLMDLIASANKYMATLSDRYRLRVQPNSFIIYVDDAYDGGSSRPANTISGGESFLVSLALALALSDIANGLQVDTLFIDEGFGTLSGQALKDAISTLSLLHSQTGRHVGIISHVEELREELPVQIRVTQNAQTSESRLQIIGR